MEKLVGNEVEALERYTECILRCWFVFGVVLGKEAEVGEEEEEEGEMAKMEMMMTGGWERVFRGVVWSRGIGEGFRRCVERGRGSGDGRGVVH